VKRAATRLRPDNDNVMPPAGGGGAALQGRPPEFESDRDDRLDKGCEPHSPRSQIGRAPMAQGHRPEGPSDAPTADEGVGISRRLPIAELPIGQFARRLVAHVIEQRRRAVEAAGFDFAAAEENPASPAPPQARVVGREAGHPLGRTH
jgi:hypothetical protein